MLAGQILLGVLYSLSTPIFEASDEIWHYPVVREIATNHRLPVQELGVTTRWVQEGSQPPLYYALAALATGWIDTSDYEQAAVLNPFAKIGIPLATDNRNMAAHPPGQSPLQGGTPLAVTLIRWLSVLLGTATAYLAFRLADAVYPDRPAVSLLTLALVAFNPMVLFINASVNNDNLLMALSTLALWMMVRDVQSVQAGPRWRSTVLLGVVVALASLTKVSGLVLLPVAAVGITVVAWRQRSWKMWLTRGVTVAVVVAAMAGWWYARNGLLYGELTGLTRMVEIAGPRPEDFGLTDLPAEWRSFWYSYWGVFGAFNILAPQWFLVLTGALTLAAGAGLIIAATRALARRMPLYAWPAHLLLVTFIALTAVGLVRWTLLTMASQGRLLFGAIAPLSLYLAFGLLAWFPRPWHRRVAGTAAAILAASAAVIAMATIRPAYQPPPAIKELPADAVTLDIPCGDSIRLAGYRIAEQQVEAGEPLDLTLYWHATRPEASNLQLSVNGYGYGGENVAKLDTWPGGGLLPTGVWQPGALYADRYLIPTLPAASTPTLIKLGISWATDLFDPADQGPVSCYVDKSPAAGVFLDAGAIVGKQTPAARLAAPAAATLQHGIRLDGYNLTQQPDKLILTLEWSATEAIPGDYTVFVHLFDGSGNKVAQGDAPPRNGQWPTFQWRPGEPVSSTHTVELPGDLPAGEYTLGTGMYDALDGQRLFAYDARGTEWRDWVIPLESITIR